MTVVQSVLLDVQQKPVGLSRVTATLGGVTNGVFTPISGWTADGQMVAGGDVLSDRFTGAWSMQLAPNATVTPANTVYQIFQEADGRRLFIVVPDSTVAQNMLDLLTAQPAQPDATVRGATLTMVPNGDDTTTVTASGLASVASNGDGTSTLTLGG